EEQDIARLVDQLGDKDYFVRQQAQDELARRGFAAFDALKSATTNDDLEIAARAKYLLGLMRIESTAKNDPPEVRNLLKDYELKSETGRLQQIQALAALPEGEGILALCRLVRFEKSELLSKMAALAVLRSAVGTDPPQGKLRAAIRKIMENSKRPAAAWLRVWLKLADDQATALGEWEKIIDAESALSRRSASESSPKIVGELIRCQIAWRIKFKQSDEALSAMRRLLELEKGDSDTLLELLDWLSDEKAWNLSIKLAGSYPRQVNSEPILLYALAEAQKRLGDESLAEDTARGAFKLNLGAEKPKLYKRLLIARHLRKAGLFGWAQREFDYIFKLGRNDDPLVIGAQYYDLAGMLHEQADDQAAADALEALLKKAGNHIGRHPQLIGLSVNEIESMMHYYQACHWQAAGEAERHRQSLLKALSLDPENVDVLIACHRLPKQTPEFQKKLDEIIRKTADNLRLKLSAQEELIRKTADNIRLKLEAQLDYASRCNQLAWLIGNTHGNLDEALQLSKKSLELTPDCAEYYDTLAHVYYARKDYDNALKYQRHAAKLKPYSGLITRQLKVFRKARDESVKKGQ
ncbi:MAG: hypothetical protein ACWGMZ_03115, partial [Thermoguttaceae bacterium]